MSDSTAQIIDEFIQEAILAHRLDTIIDEVYLRLYQQRNKSERDQGIENLFCSLLEGVIPHENMISCLAKIMLGGQIESRLDVISMFGGLSRNVLQKEPDDELLQKIVTVCELQHQGYQDQIGYSLLNETEKRLAAVLGNYFGCDPNHPNQWKIMSQTILMNDQETIDQSILFLKKEMNLDVDKLHQGKNLAQLLLETLQ